MSKLSETNRCSRRSRLKICLARSRRPAPLSSELEFSLEQRRTLLRIAHQAILSALERQPFPEARPSSPVLAESRGVFTTLYLRGELARELLVNVSNSIANFGDASGTRCPLRLCIALWLKPHAPPLSTIPVSHRNKRRSYRLEVSLSVLSRLFRFIPRPWKSDVTAWLSPMAFAAACCCPRFQWNMVGIAKLS